MRLKLPRCTIAFILVCTVAVLQHEYILQLLQDSTDLRIDGQLGKHPSSPEYPTSQSSSSSPTKSLSQKSVVVETSSDVISRIANLPLDDIVASTSGGAHRAVEKSESETSFESIGDSLEEKSVTQEPDMQSQSESATNEIIGDSLEEKSVTQEPDMQSQSESATSTSGDTDKSDAGPGKSKGGRVKVWNLPIYPDDSWGPVLRRDFLLKEFGFALLLLDNTTDSVPLKSADVNLQACADLQTRTKKEPSEIRPRDWNIQSVEDSMNWIKEGASIARFGDSEYKLTMIDGGRLIGNMIRGSPRMMQKMQETARLGGEMEIRLPGSRNGISRGTQKFCIGLNPVTKGHHGWLMFNQKNKDFWSAWLKSVAKNNHNRFFQYFAPGKYCTTSVSRPDHRTDLTWAFYWEKWQLVFHGKRVLFVGPSSEKFIVNPEGIFQCAKSVIHLPVPIWQAFNWHDEIMAKVLQHYLELRGANAGGKKGKDPWKDDIIVAMVVGPVATIMAAELACLGVHALDIGHMNPFMKVEKVKSRPCPANQRVPIQNPPSWWTDPYSTFTEKATSRHE